MPFQAALQRDLVNGPAAAQVCEAVAVLAEVQRQRRAGDVRIARALVVDDRQPPAPPSKPVL